MTDDAALPDRDDAALERLRRFGGGSLLGEMIEIFLQHAPAKVSAARAAMDAGDRDGVYAALHGLKSSAGQMGAVRMQHLCAEGEARARDGSLDGVPDIVAAIEQELPHVVRWLESARGGAA